MKKSRKPIPILVALNKSLVSRTKKLCGIFRASAESGTIELKIMDEGRDLTPDYVDREIENGIRGFIIGANGIDAAVMHIRGRKMPLVTISLPYNAGRNSVAIHTDNKAIAKEAARMLMSARTFNSYAYYPTVDSAEWSIEREEHFLKYVNQQKKVHPAVTLPRNSTAEALLALPRPVGILAANDTYAAELLDICSKTNLRIPKDVSIIGVDNEEFLCESSTPSLTSIEPDFEYEGYVAAKSLIQLLNKENAPAKIVCGIRRTVVRKSTIDENYASALVNRALEYINDKATSGITVSDVCAYLKVSRRLLGLRFHEIRKSSPMDAIIERKLAALKKELATSDLPISIVCRRCGFGSENHPKKLFRERYKMTMRDYRNHAQARKHR